MQEFQLQVDIESHGGICPKRNSDEAAGYDLYTPEDVILKSRQLTKVPLDIQTAFTPGWVGLILDRSGLGVKGISRHAGVIDSDYRGNWIVALYNHSDSDIEIKRGERVAQVVFVPIGIAEPEIVEQLPQTIRGSGGFGSTGK